MRGAPQSGFSTLICAISALSSASIWGRPPRFTQFALLLTGMRFSVHTAIVVTDQAAGTAGMALVERPEPQAAINDVIVQIHASGFVPTELAWPSTWTDRSDRDRTPSILGHELAGLRRLLRPGEQPRMQRRCGERADEFCRDECRHVEEAIFLRSCS